MKLMLYYYVWFLGLCEVVDCVLVDVIGLYSSCVFGVQGFGVQLECIFSLVDVQFEKFVLNDMLIYVFEVYVCYFFYWYIDICSFVWFIDGFVQYFFSVCFLQQQVVLGWVFCDVGDYLWFFNVGCRYGFEWEDVLEQWLIYVYSYGGDVGVRLEFEVKFWLLVYYLLLLDD